MSALANLLAAIEAHTGAIKAAVAAGLTLETGGLTGASEAIRAISQAADACVQTEREGFNAVLHELHAGGQTDAV